MTRPEHGCKDRAAAGILHRIESLRLSPAPRPLVVIIIALFVAATVALSFVLTGLMLNVDGQDGPGYLARANGAWLQSDDFHGPAYSWAIRVVASFGLEQCRAARLATIGFGALFLIASWRILSSLDRPREAALAVLLLATHPVVIEMGVAIRRT